MPKCIRCEKTVERRDQYKNWIIITYGGPKQVIERDVEDFSFIDIPSGIVWDKHSMLGLCPDCQLPKKSPEELSEKAYKNVLGCYTTLEKRIAKLERETDRIWEMIQRLGSIIE